MKKNWKYNLENKDIRSSRQSHQKKHETQKKNELLMNKLIISAYKFILDKFKHNNAYFKSLNRF